MSLQYGVPLEVYASNLPHRPALEELMGTQAPTSALPRTPWTTSSVVGTVSPGYR